MDVTIKDVAKAAGVSTATVSHVINKTRYVSPELSEKVYAAIKSTGYKGKLSISKNFRVGRMSEITYLVPNLASALYTQVGAELSRLSVREGFLFSICLTNLDRDIEEHTLAELFSNRRIAGIVLVPASNEWSDYADLLTSGVPMVFLDADFGQSPAYCVMSQYEKAMRVATTHLLENCHEKIGLLLDSQMRAVEQERLTGYRRALEKFGAVYDENNIIRLDPQQPHPTNLVKEIFREQFPTAFIAGGNRMTLILLKALEELGMECPQDVSVIGFNDDEWCEIVSPPLTAIRQDTRRIGELLFSSLARQIQGEKVEPMVEQVPATFTIRKSTQTIGRGPFGEKAVSAQEIALTEDEAESLHEKNYTVSISLHYGGTAWSRLHEMGIRNTLAKFGVKVISVTDAHFDPATQVEQLEWLRVQKPDAIIAVPTDDKITAPKFKELAKDCKLVFISNVPEGLTKDDYYSCVSVNEQENGQNAGVLLGESFRNRKHVKIGFISHGRSFYGTHLRDSVAAQVVGDRYPNLEIVDNRYFTRIEEAYDLCRQMLMTRPDIEGLYISWDRPALEAIRAIHEMGREDISIITFDLDYEIAMYLARGKMVKGMSTQRPFEQGQAAGMAVARALLGKGEYKYVGVPPYVVTADNLLRAWRDINHEPVSEEMESALRISLRK